jgi:peptidyl-prolyl cis-trans isomerase-like protein 2
LEETPVDADDRPKTEIKIVEAFVLIDPFEEFWKRKQEKETTDKEKEERKKEDRTTWTGKRIRADGTVERGEADAGVGKYLKAAMSRNQPDEEDEIVEFIDDEPEKPVRKKTKGGGGGFGNFENW